MLKLVKNKKGSKLFAGLLVFMMVMSLMPSTLFAANEATTSDSNPIQLRKKTTLQDDGTYTIDLEAYVTGEVVTQIEKQNKPTDIVLVLDQSGSMSESMSGLPNDVYSETGDITNAQAYEGSYYYKVGENYYPVTVKYASTGAIEFYKDSAGNTYDESLVSTTWEDNDGDVKEAYGPYLTSSVVKMFRYKPNLDTRYFYVVNGTSVNDWTAPSAYEAAGTDQANLRNDLREKYADRTIQFDNSDYTAAAYIQLTPVYSHTYEYYYTDAEGNMIALPAIGDSNDGSCPYSFYERGEQSGKKLDVLKYAVEQFVSGVEADAHTNGIEHRIAIVGFSSDSSSSYNNTEILTGVEISSATASTSGTYYYPDGVAYNGVQYAAGDATYTAATGTALQSVKTTEGVANIETAINSLTAHGATRADLGMQMAQDILSARTDKTRDAIVIFFTDGEPTSSSGFEEEVAADTINIAQEMKIGEEVSDGQQGSGTSGGMPTGTKLGYTASVYSIAVYDGADPNGSANINGSGAVQVNDFMHMVSSNYLHARGEKQGSRAWEFFRGDGANSGYYKVADNAASLANIFTTITNDIHQSIATINLGSTAVLKDIISPAFELPAGYNASQIEVKTAAYQGNGTWATPVEFADANVTVNGSTVEVTNFDYTANVVTEATGSVAAAGKKLIVSIPGIVGKTDAATGTEVFTNTADSGIDDLVEGTLTKIEEFERPTVTIGKELHVLDYGKKATLSLDAMDTVEHIDADGMDSFTTVTSAIDLTYGSAEISDAKLSYTPETMNWNGYDSFYAFGTKTENNTWSKVSVIPANNVYYEDDFVTNTTNGTVGIEYAGTWAVTGTSSNNQESANTEIHGGWENTDLANDTAFTDGTAHVSSTSGATATFTFTGTGVDIYSYTDINSGVICADLYVGEIAADKLAENTKALTQSYIIDNYAASGAYYQIPTASFMDLDYGTYTVQITVYAKNNTEGARSTYYLDGIRVYNPILEDDTVSEAYGEETGAWFTSVRNLLLDAESLEAGTTDTADGVVFIDQTTDATGTTTNVIGTYENLGPKNEVYLASGQAIAFQVVDPTQTYSIGLKAMTGNATTAEVTNGEGKTPYTISSTADLYYKLVPNADGLVVIKNAGDNLLSITKLKTTGEVAVEEASVMMLMSYRDTFDTLEVVDAETEPEEDTVPDVEIEDDTTDDEVEETPEQEEPSVVLQKLIKNIFDSLRSWFRR